MSTEINAYDAACKEAWEIVRSTVAAVIEQIEWYGKHDCKVGESDADDLRDTFNEEAHTWIHEACDNAMIYTRDQWVCAWALRDADYAGDFDTGETFEERLTARAFANLREAVNGSSEIEEAIEREVSRLCPEESAGES